MKRSILFLLLFAAPALGQQVTLQKEIAGEPSEFIQIKAETKDATVRWKVLDPGLNLFPVELLKDSKTAVVSAGKAGRYRVICVTAKGDVPSEFAMTTVVIGGVAPGPTPVPVPNVKAKSLTFLVLSPTQATAAVTEDAAFRKRLTDNGIGVYGITTKAQQDANPKFAGITAPAICLQDTNNFLIGSVPITTLAEANAFLSLYVGK